METHSDWHSQENGSAWTSEAKKCSRAADTQNNVGKTQVTRKKDELDQKTILKDNLMVIYDVPVKGLEKRERHLSPFSEGFFLLTRRR